MAIGDNESDDGLAEPVGGIVITDEIPIQPKFSSLEIRQLIPDTVDSLCLRHPYSIAAAPMILADFKFLYFARMTTPSPKDEENAFDNILKYMTKNELVSGFIEARSLCL